MLGTTWALVRNAIEGVTKGFAKKLEIEGVGYRAAIEGKDLVLFLAMPSRSGCRCRTDVTVAVEKNTTILFSGIEQRECRADRGEDPRAQEAGTLQRQGHPLRRRSDSQEGRQESGNDHGINESSKLSMNRTQKIELKNGAPGAAAQARGSSARPNVRGLRSIARTASSTRSLLTTRRAIRSRPLRTSE